MFGTDSTHSAVSGSINWGTLNREDPSQARSPTTSATAPMRSVLDRVTTPATRSATFTTTMNQKNGTWAPIGTIPSITTKAATSSRAASLVRARKARYAAEAM